MRTIKTLLLATLLTSAFTTHALAEDNMSHDMAKEHGGQIFHMFRLETEFGVGNESGVASWHLDGRMKSIEEVTSLFSKFDE